MAIFEQGEAPGVLMEDGEIVFRFVGRRLETEDDKTIVLARKYGAVELGCAVATVGQTSIPEGFEGLKKPEIVAKAAEIGIVISPNQSKPEMLAAVGAGVEQLKLEKTAGENDLDDPSDPSDPDNPGAGNDGE